MKYTLHYDGVREDILRLPHDKPFLFNARKTARLQNSLLGVCVCRRGGAGGGGGGKEGEGRGKR